MAGAYPPGMRIEVGIASLVAGAAIVSACAASQPVPGVAGTATLSSGTADPCRGATFDADHADPRCLHHGVGAQTPPASALQVSLASPAVARSGYDAGLVVEMKNVTNAPIAVDVDDSCGTFEAQASNPKTSSFETDCFGLCGSGPEPHVLRVTLEPGGVIRKHVKFYAVQTRVMLDKKDECVEKTMGALPAGDYDLRITLPWTDPIPEDPAVTRPRVVEAKLTVTP
jgi:hypothetical protein